MNHKKGIKMIRGTFSGPVTPVKKDAELGPVAKTLCVVTSTAAIVAVVYMRYTAVAAK